MIEKRHDAPFAYEVRIIKDSRMPNKRGENGCADLRARAVGLNEKNEGYVELSIENGYQGANRWVSEYASIQLTPEEAIAFRDTLNSISF